MVFSAPRTGGTTKLVVGIIRPERLDAVQRELAAAQVFRLTVSDVLGASIGAGVIGAIILFLWLVSGFFIVQEGQTGIVLTFGKYSHSAQAGFNWRWPYPIQSHEAVNLSQVRTVEVGYRSNVRNKLARESLMLTDDENIIDIQFAVQ